MSEEEIYSRFIDWLDKGWWHLPASEYLLQSIKAFFTPEEAALLTGIPFKPTELKELANLKGIRSEDLVVRLDSLARKGAVWRAERDGSIFYNLNDAFFIFFRGPFSAFHIDQAAAAMAPSLNRYVRDGLMDQLAPVGTKPLRTIPIGGTIEDPRRIAPYEDVMSIVESQNFIAVSNCACRQRKRADSNSAPCQHPEEVCLHFGDLAHYLVDNGLSRQISKEEAKDILKSSAEAGLVHGISNRQKDADTICNCCKCSCIFFEAYHVLKHDKSHDFSNYRLRINSETCKACGLCVQRCPVQALALEDSPVARNKQCKAAKIINPDHCLGCGVCVYKCPTQSLSLQPRGEIQDPPKDAQEWRAKLVMDQKQAKATGAIGGKK
ncbi:MAG TPA: 4Fe-4S binding protein [Nitrospirota bacterium]|nr:4Fe-4S binding protein [Nitrospirota bacterium]HYA94036.1 4Fe-4S binding protein [Thermodesulfobacteriota bacterium]